jgi:hypothetical protein
MRPRKSQGVIQQWGHEMTKKEADVIFKSEMEAVVYRFEPYNRLLCPMVRAALINRFPGIAFHYPESRDLLWVIVLDIDKDISEQCTKHLRDTAGLATVACDGVTILGKSYLLYTIAKGEYVTFEALQHLKSLAHATAAEVDDGQKKLEAALVKMNDSGGVSNLAVDNAALAIARAAVEAILIKFPSSPPIVVTRDPGHCFDLPAKDTALAKFMTGVMNTSKDVIKFVKTDNIDSVLEGMVNRGALETK